MNNSMILHHYDSSPYAEKIRLMFGLTNAGWQSVISPVQPPRPGLDKLTGGYRRIPVAQVGADIFCDTALIAREIAKATDCSALDPAAVDSAAAALMEQAEKKAFFAAIGAVKPLRLLGTMLLQIGPVGTYHFIKDRTGMMKGGTVRPPQGPRAEAELDDLLAALEKRLTEHSWVGGETVSVADFATYHPLWLYVACNRRPLKSGPKVEAWYQHVSDIGHGRREEVTLDAAFAAARESEPRSLPPSVEEVPVAKGTVVQVSPTDYGTLPVTGVLAALTEDRIILARHSNEFGQLHVHFPRAGYSLVEK
ncbi:glutathione S-transferase family protein [Allohahella marinimesophila]|uniref:Glutathione S-transferase family protein n=1 Tax=Allohahella marinimesophila TaxID=1054972 RepID=A0ABP7PHT4_9GAMM